MRKEDICFEDFCDLLIDRLRNNMAKAGITDPIIMKNVVKRNDREKKALCIEGEQEVSPVIYADDLYERLNNEDFDSLVDSACDQLITGKKSFDKCDAFEKLTHEGIKKNLTYRLINKKMNSKYLEDKVYRDFLDLAIIYLVNISVEDDIGQIVITNSLAEKLLYSEEDLYRIAMKNTPKLYPINDISLREAIGDKLPFTDDIPELFRVLTNKDKIYGASVLLYPGMVKKLHEKYGNRYIIPSSLHEVLLVGYDMDPINYLQMVKEVNSTVVDSEEILSDSVYKITSDGLSIAVTAA